MRRSSWHLRTGAIVLAWAALLIVTVALTLAGVGTWPAAHWLAIHLLTLGVVSNAIFIWTWHFAETLLRLPDPGRPAQARRLIVLNAGIVALVVGMPLADTAAIVAGATLVVAAVVWHTVALVARMRTALANRFAVCVRYYVAAGACLAVGGALGATMGTRAVSDQWEPALHLAHLTVNVLGWIGLTVAGTLVTLWPTMLRTRMAPSAEQAARRGLPVLLVGLVIAAGGAFAGPGWPVALGLATYLAGLVIVLVPFVREVWQRRPDWFATWSMLLGVAWLVGATGAFVATAAASGSVRSLSGRTDWLVAALLVGAAAQILLGALSYLVPVVLGGGPSSLRRTIADVGAAGMTRLTVVNLALPLCLLPVPRHVLQAASVVVFLALASSVVVFAGAVVRHRRRGVRGEPVDGAARPRRSEQPTPAQRQTAAAQRSGGVLIGIGVVVAAVLAGVAVDPAAAGLTAVPQLSAPSSAGPVATSAPAGVTAVTAVTVETVNMRFVPDTVRVPAGNRLRITVANRDLVTHDLVLATGASTGHIRPGGSATLDAGVIDAAVEGWCSIPGHRQMGMVFHVLAEASATGIPPMHEHAATPTPGGTPAAEPTVSMADLMQRPPADFRARSAVLPPVPAGRVHRVRLDVTETEHQVAPGVTQRLWTYNGTMPGPTLHGRIGDTFVITLVNDGSMGHSIDFHAGALAPDRPMRTIDPGQSLTYTFTATRAGIWLYHCATMPMSLHIANGMFGAVVIDPPDLPRVDRTYVLIQSELYLGPQGGIADLAKIQADRPDLVVFNGYPMQYLHRPLTAKTGERVRIWVLDAGPNAPSSFHVVGGQFDTVWTEGAYRLKAPNGPGGAQVLPLAVAQGGFVELSFPEPGHYTFVTHVMTDAERGAMGSFTITRR